jgi:thiol-disulfide isomerase/thioredoxin
VELVVRILIVLLSAIATLAAPALAQPWAPRSPSYVYAAHPRCQDPATASLRPNETRYDICADQMVLFEDAVAKARAANRLLIVDFGATWCPNCRSLQSEWRTPALLGAKSATLDANATFDLIEIGISTLHNGRLSDVASGHAVLALVLAATPASKQRSVPFVAVVDPTDRTKTVARNLDDLQLAKGIRHDPARLLGWLKAAHAHMRAGGPPPTEPGWLRLKFNRAWVRLFGG